MGGGHHHQHQMFQHMGAMAVGGAGSGAEFAPAPGAPPHHPHHHRAAKSCDFDMVGEALGAVHGQQHTEFGNIYHTMHHYPGQFYPTATMPAANLHQQQQQQYIE